MLQNKIYKTGQQAIGFALVKVKGLDITEIMGTVALMALIFILACL